MAEGKTATTQEDTVARGRRKTLTGLVVSAKMSKTRRIEVPRMQKHPKYGKYVRRRTVCHAHDEKNETKEGDTVEIMETRPMSKLKRWRIVKVVRAAGAAVGEIRDDAGLQKAAEEALAKKTDVKKADAKS